MTENTELEAIGRQLREARQRLDDVMTTAREAAIIAVAEGASEMEVARKLGVDRARTLRRWLGK